MTSPDQDDREIIATRVFDAPRELVFNAWLDPIQLARWWGPAGFTNTFHEFDPRPGGTWRFTMHGPDGTDYLNDNVFVEITWPARIAIDHLSAPKFRITATFEALGAKTRLTFRQLFETAEIRRKVAVYAVPANEQLFDKLAAVVARDLPLRREVVITRMLDAPRELVWAAWTEADRLARWWGPRGFTAPVCRIDPRPGGDIYIVMRAPDGSEFAMNGVYREVVAPERLVFTNNPLDAEGKPMAEGFTTITFTAHGDRTEMTVRSQSAVLVASAAFMLEGMQEGWSQSLDKMAEYVAG